MDKEIELDIVYQEELLEELVLCLLEALPEE